MREVVPLLVGLLLFEFLLVGVYFIFLPKLFLPYFVSFLFFNFILFVYFHVPLRFFLLPFWLILSLF